MVLRTVTLDLPDEEYELIAQIDAASNQSVEHVLRQSVDFMVQLPPLTGQAEPILQAMESCTDMQLLAVVYRPFAPDDSLRLDALNEKIEEGILTQAEHEELLRLVTLLDRHTLLRAQAFYLLKTRGYDIDLGLSLTHLPHP